MSPARQPWWLPLATVVGAVVLGLLGRSWRLDQQDDPEYVATRRAGQPVLYYFWHSGLLALVHTHRQEGIAVLVSQHRDGELVARLIEHNGFVTARGSSTRGGEIGIRELLRHARAGRDLGITPDGPRGPAEQLKGALVPLASRLQLPVVPIAAAAHPTWFARSWDRFRVPKPFARVCISHGRPILVPRDLGPDEARAMHVELEETLRALTARVRARAGELS